MVFYAPIATLYRQAAGVTVFQITIIESISLALTVGLELPWGVVADRIGYRKTMLLCCGLYLLSKLVFWRAEGFPMFLLERVLLAVVISGLSGVDASLLYLSAGEKHAQRAFGVYESAGTLGLMAAAVAFTLFVKDNYRLAGLLTVGSYLIAFLLAFSLKEIHDPQKEKKKRGEMGRAVGALLTNKRLLLLLAAAALLGEAKQTITVFLSQLQYVRCGMDSARTGAAYLLLTAAGLLGVFSARATKRLGEKRLGAMLFLAAALSCAALCFTTSALLSVGLLCLLAVGNSLFQPLQMTLQNRCVASRSRATALSANAVVMDGVAIATNLGFGYAADTSLPIAFLLGALLCLVGLVCFLCWGRGDISAAGAYDSDAQN